MPARNAESPIGRIAVLADPVRRGLYLFVAQSPGEVSRDQAARAMRISRPLAAFHLDKLVEQGLLEASYRRLSGRTGRGAGRPAKLYRRSPQELRVVLPERRYDVVARILARGVAAGGGPKGLAAVRRAARQFGTALGTGARARLAGRPTRARLLLETEAVLREYGFEPVRLEPGLRLRNCPFDAVARDYRALVCGANLRMIEGLLAGLRIPGIKAELDPQQGQCCVALSNAPEAQRKYR
jgi:predicted ArsR family transcriptional regulator